MNKLTVYIGVFMLSFANASLPPSSSYSCMPVQDISNIYSSDNLRNWLFQTHTPHLIRYCRGKSQYCWQSDCARSLKSASILFEDDADLPNIFSPVPSRYDHNTQDVSLVYTVNGIYQYLFENQIPYEIDFVSENIRYYWQSPKIPTKEEKEIEEKVEMLMRVCPDMTIEKIAELAGRDVELIEEIYNAKKQTIIRHRCTEIPSDILQAIVEIRLTKGCSASVILDELWSVGQRTTMEEIGMVLARMRYRPKRKVHDDAKPVRNFQNLPKLGKTLKISKTYEMLFQTTHSPEEGRKPNRWTCLHP